MLGRYVSLNIILFSILLVAESLAAQSPPQGTISPGDGSYNVGTQLTVHITFCSISSFFDASGSVWLNGNPLGSTQPGSSPGCSDFQSGDFPITIAAGANTVTGQATDAYGTASVSATYTGVVPPPPPTISLLPYNANLSGGGDGVSYLHSTPAVGSMGTSQSLSLVYNSTAARPVALVFMDVTGPTSPAPTTYQLQVQLQSNGTYLTLMNNATSVYYTATAGIVDRLTAAIDAKANALTTGSYPVRLVLTTYYPGSTHVDTVASRILVNDQTNSYFGAGVGLKGIGRLYGSGSASGRTLVDGSGAMEYFDRTCAGCAFTSAAGESGTLRGFSNGTADTLFRLTAIDGSFADFNSQGLLIRHHILPGVQDLTFTWWNSGDSLKTVTDASGRGFALTYGTGGKLTQITDLAGRVLGTTVSSGLLVKVTDPDVGVDSLTYNANNQLIQLNSRTGGIWNYGYNALQQGDTIRAPSAIDYTGTNVRPTTTVATAAEVQWQPGLAGTSLGAPKGSIRPDTVYSSLTDPLGHATKTQVDRFGLSTKVVDALGQVATITRDTLGNATLVREPTGHVKTASYTGYFLTASYDSSTRQSLVYTYGQTTANQGLSAAYGWVNGGSDGSNTLSLNAIDDQTVAAGSRLYNTVGDPTPGASLPAVDSNYTIQYKLIATTPTISPGNNSTITAVLYKEYSTNSGATWTRTGDTVNISATSNLGVVTTTQVFTSVLKFAGGGPVWIRLILRGIAGGNQGGGQVRVQVFANSNWTTDPYPVLWFNSASGTPPRLLAVKGGAQRQDYYYHDGSLGPAGTLKEVYAGNSLAPGSVPQGGAVIAWHYPSAYGQDTLVIDGGGHRSRWVYDLPGSGGNLRQKIDALGHVTALHYSAYGLVDTTTLANGVKQAATYDPINRLATSTNGLGYVTHYSYGALGLTRLTDPKGQVYKFDVNAWGAVVAQHDLGDTTQVDSLKYDAGGEPRTVRTRRGDTITLTFDQLGRLRTRSGPDFPAESLSYGLLSAGGSWTVASSSNGRDSLAYDKAGRLVYATQHFPGGDTTTYAMTYAYDSTGHLISRTAPTQGSPARWVYHKELGVLDTMCAVGTCTAVARDTELKPVTLTYNVGAASPWSQTLSYDSLHHVTTGLWSGWTYDSVGRVSVQLSDGVNSYPREVYSYDAAGNLINGCQMTLVTSPCRNEYNQNSTIAYAYDSAGNRADTTARAVIGAGNRVTQFKGYAVTYDANGGIIKKAGLGTIGIWNSTDTTTFQWNAVGQLTRVEKWPAGGAHSVVTFRYDALGRRIGKAVNGVTTWFLYDGDQVEMDLDSATHAMKAEYGFADDGALYVLRTTTDTAVAITTPTIGTMLGIARARGGTVLKAFSDRVGNSPLFPWGQEPADTGFIVRYRMAGQEYDQETGLYHMGARYEDPLLGRWLSEDPAGIAGGTNLYSYAGNDPVNRRDPSGLYECSATPNSNFISCSFHMSECPTEDETMCAQMIFRQDCLARNGEWNTGKCEFWPDPSGGPEPWAGATSGYLAKQQSNFDRQLALDDFRAGQQRRARIRAAEIIGERAKCALGALAFGANFIESFESVVGLYEITAGAASATLVGGISGVTGATATSDAVVMQGARMVAAGGLLIAGTKALSVRAFAGGVDAASGEFGFGNFVPGVGVVKAIHTIENNC